jgi:hypothetical protein
MEIPMKKIVKKFVFVSMLSTLFAVYGCTASGLIDPFETPWDDRSLFEDGLIDSEKGILDGLPGASVYHVDVRIADDYLSLDGWEEVHYTNREDVPLQEIYFQLFPNAAGGRTSISGLSVNGQDVDPQFEFEGSALKAALPAPLAPQETVDIRLEFEVTLAQEMAGNYGLFGYFDGIIVLDEFYPVIPVYDDEGWNVQYPPPNADTSYFDASFYIVRVSAPAGLVMAASGVEIGREKSGGEQSVVYAAGPSRDFYLAASEQYTLVSGQVGETNVNSYALKGYEQGAEAALQYALDAIAAFNARFGDYPYTEFDILSTPLLAIGIEYPGIVGIVVDAYDPAKEVSGLPFPIILESGVVHEVAHQWFYSVVGSDQIDDPWLDEAVAQYATWLYFVDMYGEENARGFRDYWEVRWDRVERAPIPIGLPAAEYEGSEYGAIVYGRGPLFLEALSQAMGTGNFRSFLKDYFTTQKWGIATPDSFKTIAESHCSCDLSPLFDVWVYP